MSLPDAIFRSRCGCTAGTCDKVEYTDGARPTLYGSDEPDRDAVEYARVTPSVRLARWLDADPGRSCELLMGNDEEWSCHVYAPHRHEVTGLGPTRDEAITAALDQAEGVER